MQHRQTFPRASSLLKYALIAAAMLLLASCSLPGSPSSGNSQTPIKNPADIHVGFISATAGLDFALEMAAGAQYAANQFHVQAQIVAPATNGDGHEEVTMFQKLAQTAHDGIAVETLAPDLFIQPEANAIKQGIPIVAVDTTGLPGSGVQTFIGNDNVTAGAQLADEAIRHIPVNAQGQVLIGIDTEITPLQNRALGIQQEFKRLRPGINVVTPFHSQQENAANLAAWQNTISTHNDLVTCLGVGDPDNSSLAQIKQEQHSTYLTGAFDLDPTALQAIANGTNFALVDPEHFMKGYIAMRLIIEHALYGNAIPQGWWNPGSLLVTQSNVQQIIHRQTSLAAKGEFYKSVIDEQFANEAAQIKPMDQAR